MALTTLSDKHPRTTLLVDLALQGGGSHGAFTWGVLDRLLDEEWLVFDGISGTSAGAMNAAVMADGLAEGGRQGAQKALAYYWQKVAEAALLSPFKRGPVEILTGQWTLDYSPLFLAADLAARVYSPYLLPASQSNPLERVLLECIDFERPWPSVSQCGNHARGLDGLRLPAHYVPRGRN
jgi:NTE family protein